MEGPVRSGDVHQSVLARVDSHLSTARVYYPEVIRLADRLGGFSSDLHHSFVRAGILAQINPAVGSRPVGQAPGCSQLLQWPC